MIKDTRLVMGLRICENWFEYEDSNPLSLNVYLHIQNKKKPLFHLKRLSHTIENSLEESEEEIFSRISTTYKYQIKKAKREGVVCADENDVTNYAEFYNQFATIKNLSKTSETRLKQLQGNMVLRKAMLNETKVAQHSYFLDHDLGIARLHHSATHHHIDSENAAQIGRANKLLMFEDMIYLKNKGFKRFDFGGFYFEEENQGINNFKLSFGGKKVICVNYYTLPSLILRKAAGILENFKKPGAE